MQYTDEKADEMKRRWDMNFIWLLLALFCIGYYFVCVSYAGIKSAFVWIWLAGFMAFIAIFILVIMEKHGIISIHKYAKIAFVIIFLSGVTIFVVLQGLIINSMFSTPKQDCDYVIVLGAQVRGTTITKSLRYRLEVAYDYAMDNPNTKIIVSGGQGDGEDVSEAFAMKRYLTERGIDESRIIMEGKSRDTSQNIKYSKAMIEDISGSSDFENISIAIATSDFHIYRGMQLAKGQGLSNVSGIPGKTDSTLKLNYMVREAVGIVKDMLVGNF